VVPGRRRPVGAAGRPRPSHPQGKPPANGTRQTLASSKLWLTATNLRNNMERGRIQARGARPDLPQNQSRQLRRASRSSCSPGATTRAPTPEDPTNYRPQSCFLGAGRGPLGQTATAQCQNRPRSASSWTTHGGDRARQTHASKACCRRITQSWARQAAPGELIDCDRHDRKLTAAAKARACLRRAIRSWLLGPGVRILPPPLCLSEGKNGGQFYTPKLCGALPEWNAGALTRAASRPLLRLGRHVVAEPRMFPWKAHGGPAGRHFIYGQEAKSTTPPAGSVNLAPARHRGRPSPRACRQLSARDIHPDLRAISANPPIRPSNDSDCVSARTRRAPGSTAYRRRQRQLRLASSFITTWRPRHGPASCSPTAAMSSNQSAKARFRPA